MLLARETLRIGGPTNRCISVPTLEGPPCPGSWWESSSRKTMAGRRKEDNAKIMLRTVAHRPASVHLHPFPLDQALETKVEFIRQEWYLQTREEVDLGAKKVMKKRCLSPHYSTEFKHLFCFLAVNFTQRRTSLDSWQSRENKPELGAKQLKYWWRSNIGKKGKKRPVCNRRDKCNMAVWGGILNNYYYYLRKFLKGICKHEIRTRCVHEKLFVILP